MKNAIIVLLAAGLLIVGIKAFGKTSPSPVMIPGPPDLDTKENQQKCKKDYNSAMEAMMTMDQMPLVGIITMVCPYTKSIYKLGSDGISSSNSLSTSTVFQSQINYLQSKGWKRA